MKTCIYCAEEIQDAAIKCRHCGEFLDGSGQGRQGSRADKKWYVVLLYCMLLGPLALHIVWSHPRYSITKKAVITAAIIAFTFGIIYGGEMFCSRILPGGNTLAELEQQMKTLGY